MTNGVVRLQFRSARYFGTYYIASTLATAYFVQDYWLHHRLCSSEYPHAYRWTNHQRFGGRYLLSTSARLHLRNCASKQTWPSSRMSTMGYHMGYHDYVLHLLRSKSCQRSSSFQNSMGYSNDTSHHPLLRTLPVARITQMARQEQPLGRSSRGHGSPPSRSRR